MAKRSRISSSKSGLNSFLIENASAEAAWSEALGIRELGSNERTRSRKRLAQAQAARLQAENEAITATKDYCAQVRAQADNNLLQAERARSEAELIKDNAAARAKTLEDEIQFRLDDASNKRKNARSYAENIESAARGAADALMNQTREGAKELTSRMRQDAAEHIRKILSDIEVSRAAAEDELAAQRLLTETARVKAFTVGLEASAAQPEPLAFASIQNKTPGKPTASAKVRSAKVRSSRSKSKSKSARKAA